MKIILIKVNDGYLVTQYSDLKIDTISKVEDVEHRVVETDEVEILSDDNVYFIMPKKEAEELWNG